jgi:serine/threonine protein kinase HipA of HipAB toxin-antitoxin module
LIGNADAHAKNFALLYPELGVARLAPAYDLVSTHVYGHLTYNMATAINGIYDSRGILPVHWQREFVRLGLRERLNAARMNELPTVYMTRCARRRRGSPRRARNTVSSIPSQAS